MGNREEERRWERVTFKAVNTKTLKKIYISRDIDYITAAATG